MDRHSHLKHLEMFLPSVPPVDTFLQGRNEGFTSYPILNSGLTSTIYDFNGNINYTLPLEDWPPINDYHRDVYLMQRYGNLYTKKFL